MSEKTYIFTPNLTDGLTMSTDNNAEDPRNIQDDSRDYAAAAAAAAITRDNAFTAALAAKSAAQTAAENARDIAAITRDNAFTDAAAARSAAGGVAQTAIVNAYAARDLALAAAASAATQDEATQAAAAAELIYFNQITAANAIISAAGYAYDIAIVNANRFYNTSIEFIDIDLTAANTAYTNAIAAANDDYNIAIAAATTNATTNGTTTNGTTTNGTTTNATTNGTTTNGTTTNGTTTNGTTTNGTTTNGTTTNGTTTNAPAPVPGPGTADPICFNEGTKILCFNKNLQEEYISIEHLKKGDLVKTYKHGYRRIDLIGKNVMVNNPDNSKKCMYKMVKTDKNCLLEDLIITGGHSILVDDPKLLDKKRKIKKVDDKYLLFSSISKDFIKLTNNNLYTYWHLTLETDDDNQRFGIWSNGLLTETTYKKSFIKHNFKGEFSGDKNIVSQDKGKCHKIKFNIIPMLNLFKHLSHKR